MNAADRRRIAASRKLVADLLKKSPVEKRDWMAFNHNGTELMKEYGTKAEAEREVRAYRRATGNAAYAEQECRHQFEPHPHRDAVDVCFHCGKVQK